MHDSAILLISCPDRKGVVASIADFIFKHNGNILFADEHGDEASNLFLTRVEFDPADFDFDLTQFAERFAAIAREFQMDWRLAHSSDRPRIAIFVSKYDHCLQDLLYRHQSGELRCEIPLIISNHPDNQRIADFYRVPYFVVPVTKENKQKSELEQIALVREHKCTLVVLARYMQVLSNEFISNLGSENLINIHHSFLPAFVGSKPYHQAFKRGVKLIGATAHYVTQVLDDGPSSSRMSSVSTTGTPSMISFRRAATSKKWCYHAPFAGILKTASCYTETKPWFFSKRGKRGSRTYH